MDQDDQPVEHGGLDFRDIQSINDAFLTKLSWRIIRKPDSLFARILLGKYCPAGDFLTCSMSSSCSHGWRGIMNGRDLIMENAGWAVGNGENLNIWEAPWLSLSRQERPMGPAPEALINISVSELFLPGKNEWDVEKIRQVLPCEEHRIRSIKQSLTGAPNKLMWLQSPTGEYTTKTGYIAALPNHQPVVPIPQGLQNFEWKRNVWKLQTAPKIKLFLWKAFHGALPVGDQLRARQIAVEGKCKNCGQPESIDHLFLHCSFAKQVWASAPVWPSVDYSGNIDLRDEWSNLCSKKNLPPTGLATGALAPWILWQLWKARNNLVFNDRTSSVAEILSKATATAREWASSQMTPTEQPRGIQGADR